REPGGQGPSGRRRKMRPLLEDRPGTLQRGAVRWCLSALRGRARNRRRTGGRVIPHEDTPVPPAAHALAPFVRPIEVATIVGIIVLDQLTKFAVRATIPLYAKRSIIPDLLDLTHVQNTGAAFGVLNAADFPFKSIVMIAVAALALVAISLYARQLG